MKRFKAKKTKRRRNFLILFFLTVVSFSITISFFHAMINKEDLIDQMISSSLSIKPKEITIVEPTFDEENIPTIKEENPLIYLYNTHQTEEYQMNYQESYHVIPTVLFASYKLREELNKRNLQTIVEDNKIEEILRIQNWNYNASYQVSRMLLEDRKKKNPSLQYFFDLHRDAIPYESSTLKTNEKNYAKILFVIGTDHPNYPFNLEFAEKISTKMNELVSGISRGILPKGGKGVNGIYNQDFSKETLLFEIGGQYNNINEVSNTLIILAEALKELIG